MDMTKGQWLSTYLNYIKYNYIKYNNNNNNNNNNDDDDNHSMHS